MKKLNLIIIMFASVIFLNAQTKSYQQLQTEKRNLENQIALLKAQLKQVEVQMAQLKNDGSNVVIVGQANNQIKTTAGTGGAILRDKPASTGNILSTISAGESIILYKEKTGLYIKASYNGKVGYVSYTSLNATPELDVFMKKKVNEPKTIATSKTTVSTVDTNSQEYKRLAKIYGHDKAVKILNHQLWKGMSHGMVIESLGQPSERTSVNSPQGLREEWKYSNKKVNFVNGSVDSWEDR